MNDFGQMTRRAYLLVLLSLILLLLAGCDSGGSVGYETFNTGIDIGPLFREYYETHGGAAQLGPAISPLFTDEYNRSYQYLVSGLLVFDTGVQGGSRINFSPLGLEMKVAEPQVARRPGSPERYIEGHYVYQPFAAKFDALGGLSVVGPPLTEVHFNPDKQRYTQYFKNLGFYMYAGGSADEVGLLSYGAWMCTPKYCEPGPPRAAPDRIFHTETMFVDAQSRLGADFTGAAIGPAYQTPDNYQEQTFGNVALVADPSRPGGVSLRALPRILRSGSSQPVVYNGDPNYYFYPLQQGGLGYNIPNAFRDYIAQHGGMEIFGAPIGELFKESEILFSQCFEHVCLELKVEADGYYAIHPVELGYQYLQLPTRPYSEDAEYEISQQVQPEEAPAPEQQAPAEPAAPVEPEPVQPPQQEVTAQPTVESMSDAHSAKEITLQVWETYPMVAPGESQEIGVSVLEDNAPLSWIAPDLVLTLPDGREKTYFMYETGSDGITRMTLDPIEAPNGTLIPYHVCIYTPGGQKFCVKDSFLIWQNP